jgi:hypothetical protein
MMKSYFPQLKRRCQTLDVSIDEVMNVNPLWTMAMLKPCKRERITRWP